jgi:nucleoside-diphosphate-sugar epimerase
MTVLVLGATGNLGPRVVASLLQRGAATRVLTRDPDRARTLPPTGVEVCRSHAFIPTTWPRRPLGIRHHHRRRGHRPAAPTVEDSLHDKRDTLAYLAPDKAAHQNRADEQYRHPHTAPRNDANDPQPGHETPARPTRRILDHGWSR